MKEETQTTVIKKFRLKSGLSQAALAEKSGISLRTIQRLEKGNVNTTSETLQKIADALGVDYGTFYGQILIEKGRKTLLEEKLQELPAEVVIEMIKETAKESEQMKDLRQRYISDYDSMNVEGQVCAAGVVRVLANQAGFKKK